MRTDSAVGDMPEVNLVILGAPGVGKSNFVQRALGLAGPSPTFLSSRKMLIGGVIYMVRLLELELDRLDLDERGRIRWPAAVDDIDLPRIHGALVLCDLDQPRSIEAIPAILGGFCLLFGAHAAVVPFIGKRTIETRPSSTGIRSFMHESLAVLSPPLWFSWSLLLCSDFTPGDHRCRSGSSPNIRDADVSTIRCRYHGGGRPPFGFRRLEMRSACRIASDSAVDLSTGRAWPGPGRLRSACDRHV